MKYKFIKSGEKKDIIEQLSVLGISEIPYLLIESGKEKIRGTKTDQPTAETITTKIHKVTLNLNEKFSSYRDTGMFNESKKGISLNLTRVSR